MISSSSSSDSLGAESPSLGIWGTAYFPYSCTGTFGSESLVIWLHKAFAQISARGTGSIGWKSNGSAGGGAVVSVALVFAGAATSGAWGRVNSIGVPAGVPFFAVPILLDGLQWLPLLLQALALLLPFTDPDLLFPEAWVISLDCPTSSKVALVSPISNALSKWLGVKIHTVPPLSDCLHRG